MADFEDNIVPEFAFHDISHRASVFRTRLIEEFQLLDNIVESNSVQSPQYTTKDMRDPKILRKLLLENPMQLVKFNQFKRKFQVNQVKKKDRRLTRAKNMNSLPVDAWAAWVISSAVTQKFLVALIVINSILAGVSAEWAETRHEHWALFQMITILDNISLVIFFGEMLLKWIDDFNAFWADGWNIFDFIITVMSAIPNIIELLGPTGGNDGLNNVLVQLRALRIVRTLKIIVRFGNLKIIVVTIINAADSMAVVFLLIMVAAYIFAIVGMNIFTEYTKSMDPSISADSHFAFSTVPHSMWSVFRLLTFDNWDRSAQELMKVSDAASVYAYFIFWIWLGGFIFRNVFTAVLVTDFQKITEQMQEERKEYIKLRKFDKIRKKLNRELNVRANIQQQTATTEKEMPKLRQLSAEEQLESEAHAALASAQRNAALHKGINDYMPSSGFDGIEGASPEEIRRIQELESGKGWEKTVEEMIQALSTKPVSSVWPRDTLFKYLQLMENLQENMREYEELQNMACLALLSLHDE